MYDVLIIGCGIVGAATAHALGRYRLRVAVLEKHSDIAAGTTKANSGILHAGYDAPPGSLMASLNVKGNRMADELCDKLDVPVRRCGSLVLALGPEELPTLERLYRQGQQNGVPGLELIGSRRLRELEPGVSAEAVGALRAPSAKIVSPWEYALALAETAVRNGVALHRSTTVTAIARQEGLWRVDTNRGSFVARAVVNAAGVHADRVHNMAVSPDFEILPDRGAYYLLDKSEGETVGHVVFQCPTPLGKGVLVAPTVHGNLIVGPNNERPQTGDDVSTAAAGLQEVAALARRSVPGVNLGASIRNFAGVQAASDREDFIIREAAPGFVDLAGIKSPGLTAAPAIGEMAVELLRDGGMAMEQREQVVERRERLRFAQLPPQERAALVGRCPAYGQVICRCETVTEGEILDALQAPIPPLSVEAVKRRCGAGMGRCQGGFCGPRIVGLLSRQLDVPPTEILQENPGSEILLAETKGWREARHEHAI